MKKAILVVSFGTSHLVQKAESIDPCIEAIKKAFKEWDVYETFSSGFLRKKLKAEQGLALLSPEEWMAQLQEAGYEKVIIQPLFLIEGIEYDKLIELARGYKDRLEVQVGNTLLSRKEDYRTLVEELVAEYSGKRTQLLVLGHGSSHEAHVSYKRLQEVLDEVGLRAYVTTLEDRDAIDTLPFQKGQVTLIPFMLVAGNHILKDVLGEEDHSWMSGLTKLGYEVDVVQKGLGSYESTRRIYISHIQRLLEG